MGILTNGFEQVTDIQVLAKAHRKAMAGKRRNGKGAASNYKFMSGLLELQRELLEGSYHPRPYRDRIIREPKTRHIQAPDFRDRVIHHAIHSILNPFYERHFIPDSYACRPNRGIHKAASKVQRILRQADSPLYVCKLDISKYYPSVNHERLRALLKKRIDDPKLLRLLDVIIGSADSGTEHDDLFPPDSPFHTKGRRGIPIGNLTSQLFANIYLHEADMYAKQQLKIRRYVRYMDDILIFHEDKQQLRAWQSAMVRFLHDELYLTVNPHKVRIYPARQGVDFVGYVIFPDFMRVRGASVRRFRKKFKRRLQRFVDGTMGRQQVEAGLRAWHAHAGHARAGKLTRQMDRLYADYSFVRSVQTFWRKRQKSKPEHSQLSLFDE